MEFQKNQKIAVVIALIVVGAFFLSGTIISMFSDAGQFSSSPDDEQGSQGAAPSLEIETIKKGEGEQAVAGSIVTVEYRGMFENGQVFDASEQYGEPFTFQLGVGAVIPGWDIGLQGMREGGVRRLVVPSGLAYGAQGRGPIPPNATLIFEIELVEVRTPTE